MVDLRNLETTGPTVATYPGTIVNTSTTGVVLAVNVNGNVLPARWADPLVVAVGDSVLVEVSGGATGQGEAFVKCRLTAAPRPAQATVTTVPPASPTITVTGTDGTVYTATFVASYTPTVSDVVILSWNAAVPTVLGKVGTVAAPTPGPGGGVAPPPGPGAVGTSFYPATDSGTYETGFGWEAWAGGGGHLYQGGSAYGATGNTGAWFYGGAVTELAGRTITRIRFRLSTRRNVGAANSPATVHFYAHTSPNRPGGDVSRTVGPFDVTIPPGWSGDTIDLPTSFGAVLQAGGGISINGEPYAGFLGRLAQTDSGTMTIDWSR